MNIRQIALCAYKGSAVAKDALILDFGCGAGQRVYDLLDSGYSNSYGFDNQDYLALRKPADRTRFAIAADGRIPFPDASFAFVFSDQVFEHVLDQETAFREIYRVLQPGGCSVHVIPAKWPGSNHTSTCRSAALAPSSNTAIIFFGLGSGFVTSFSVA